MSYYENNKSVIKIQQREYRNRVDVKEYRNNQKKEYYVENKENILEYNSVVFNCSCGKTYTRRHKQRHFRTRFHLNNS